MKAFSANALFGTTEESTALLTLGALTETTKTTRWRGRLVQLGERGRRQDQFRATGLEQGYRQGDPKKWSRQYMIVIDKEVPEDATVFDGEGASVLPVDLGKLTADELERCQERQAEMLESRQERQDDENLDLNGES